MAQFNFNMFLLLDEDLINIIYLKKYIIKKKIPKSYP